MADGCPPPTAVDRPFLARAACPVSRSDEIGCPDETRAHLPFAVSRFSLYTNQALTKPLP